MAALSRARRRKPTSVCFAFLFLLIWGVSYTRFVLRMIREEEADADEPATDAQADGLDEPSAQDGPESPPEPALAPIAAPSTQEQALPSRGAHATFDWNVVRGNAFQMALWYRPTGVTMAQLLANHTLRSHCRQLSGVPQLLGLAADGALLGKCAVVGGSGILAEVPRGPQIDAADVVFRVNKCPTTGWERMVGARTDVRFANVPSSMEWTKRARDWEHTRRGRSDDPSDFPVDAFPGGADVGGAVLVSGGGTVDVRLLESTLPKGARVAKGGSDFRKACVNALFDEADVIDSIHARGLKPFEPTFGVEALTHALVNCRSVDAFGFLLRDEDVHKLSGGEGDLAMRTPYHYWENETVDARVTDSHRPWSYAHHDFGLEARTLSRWAGPGSGVDLTYWTDQPVHSDPESEE